MTHYSKQKTDGTLLSFFQNKLTAKASDELKAVVASKKEEKIWTVWKSILTRRADFLQLGLHRRRLFWGFDLTIAGCELLSVTSKQTKQPPRWIHFDGIPRKTDPAFRIDSQTEAILDFYAHLIELPLFMDSASPSLWLDQMAEIEKIISRLTPLISSDEFSLPGQLLAGEIPLLLNALYPDLRLTNVSKKAAENRLKNGLATFLDSVGIPAFESFSTFRPLLAVWTRSQILAQMIGETLFCGSTAKRFEWGLLQNVRLLRPDGTLAFTKKDFPDKTRRETLRLFLEMIREAISFDHDSPDQAAVALSVDRLIGSKERNLFPVKFSQSDAPEAPSFSEDSSLGVFRHEWGTGKTALFTAIPSSKLFSYQTELHHRGGTFLDGFWDASIQVNGKSLEAVGDWSLNGEESDESRIYSEMTRSLSDGKRLERSILYVPEDQILLLSDAMIDESETDSVGTNVLSYEGRLSLAKGIDALPDPEGCEILLRNAGRAGIRLFPLALNEWRDNLPAGHDFNVSAKNIVLRLSQTGNALFAPILFDLDSSRIKRRFTWRKLTVGEEMAKVGDDKGVGYRVHLNRQQFLLYRSLSGPACRSVMGQHYDQEFVFARFDPINGIENILEISPIEDKPTI